MLMKTSIITLTQNDYRFINDVLTRSGALGQYFLTRYKKMLSYAELLMPKAPDRRYPFECGGVGIAYMDRLVQWMHRKLATTSGAILLYNEDARTTHERVHGFLYPLYFRREVYHLITPSFRTQDIQQSIMEAGTGISLVGILFEDMPISILPDSRIHGIILNRCFSSTRTLIMGVYDGEASLLLHLKQTAPGPSRSIYKIKNKKVAKEEMG